MADPGDRSSAIHEKCARNARGGAVHLEPITTKAFTGRISGSRSAMESTQGRRHRNCGAFAASLRTGRSSLGIKLLFINTKMKFEFFTKETVELMIGRALSDFSSLLHGAGRLSVAGLGRGAKAALMISLSRNGR